MSYLVKTIVYFPALKACMVSSVSMKAGPQEEAFKSLPAQGPLGLISKVFDVFSNRDLPYTSGGQSRATVARCYVWGSFGQP